MTSESAPNGNPCNEAVPECPSHGPQAVAAQVRVATVKVALTRSDADRATYRRLRDLGWQAARYRNQMSLAIWARANNYRVPENPDENAVSKAVRKEWKSELSGDAYSACEVEVKAAWARDGKLILAGRPVPTWRPEAALVVTGRENRNNSGVLVEKRDEWYVLRLRVQSKDCEGGCWIELPLAKGSRRDEFLGPLLEQFSTWQTPIKKAAVTLQESNREVRVKLAYKKLVAQLPPMGQRIAVLNIDRDGRCILRTETQRKDYTSELFLLRERKNDWDLIRRRAICQIGWRKGHARTKRKVLARLSWDDWLSNHLHTWSRKLVDWCASQGVGTIEFANLIHQDWPAYRFISLVQYKAEEIGMQVRECADPTEGVGDKTAQATLRKREAKTRKRAQAVRELTYALDV